MQYSHILTRAEKHSRATSEYEINLFSKTAIRADFAQTFRFKLRLWYHQCYNETLLELLIAALQQRFCIRIRHITTVLICGFVDRCDSRGFPQASKHTTNPHTL